MEEKKKFLIPSFPEENLVWRVLQEIMVMRQVDGSVFRESQ